MVATYDDAALVLQLVRWGTEMGLDEATTELWVDGFDPQAASVDEPAVRKMLQFGETVGTLVKQGVLDRGLIEDLWWVHGAWERVGPAALRERARMGEARIFENFEALAAGT